MTCRVRVVPDAGGWRIIVCIGRRQFEGETVFVRQRDAAKAATKIAQEIGAEYVPTSEHLGRSVRRRGEG
jgi:hypothetical protein